MSSQIKSTAHIGIWWKLWVEKLARDKIMSWSRMHRSQVPYWFIQTQNRSWRGSIVRWQPFQTINALKLSVKCKFCLTRSCSMELHVISEPMCEQNVRMCVWVIWDWWDWRALSCWNMHNRFIRLYLQVRCLSYCLKMRNADKSTGKRHSMKFLLLNTLDNKLSERGQNYRFD